jgi:hypothetical protein
MFHVGIKLYAGLNTPDIPWLVWFEIIGAVVLLSTSWRQCRESLVFAANKLLRRKNSSLALVIFR